VAVGFFSRLRGGNKQEPGPAGWNTGTKPALWPPPGPITTWPTGSVNIQGSAWVFDPHPRQYVDVVGESHYQPALEYIAGGRGADGPRNPDHQALLLPEPTNEHDPNAIRVMVTATEGGTGGLVGYLSREDAVAYRPVIDRLAESGRVTMCQATVTGGWDRMVSFGVHLLIGPPWSLMAELDAGLGPDPRWPPEVTQAADPNERPYNRTDCPYCGVEMHPLPKRKRACPSCGQAVSVLSGPDGVRYLLRQVDLAAHQARWNDFLNG